MNRKSGLDIYRILCCIGVLGYHVLDDVHPFEGETMILYYACSFCVPGFFMLSGYLLGCRPILSVEYSEKKIISVIKKLFGWVIFWVIVHFVRTGELYDVWTNMSQTITASGIEPVAWFLCTYCLLMVVAPALHYGMKKSPIIFYIVIVLWLRVLATGKLDFIREVRPQSLWLHLYAGYFAIGMVCADIYIRMSDFQKKISWLAAIVIAVVSSFVYYREVFIDMNGLAPHQNYGAWYYSLWLISLFVLISNYDVKNEIIQRILKRISKNTFTVYLGHLPLLLFITSAKSLNSLGTAIVYIIILFVITLVMAEVFNRLPLLRKIT